MAGVLSISQEAAAIDDSRRAKALEDARLIHYPPEVPPDMVSRAERVAINQFVELWLEEIPDEEALMRKAMRERAKDANGNYAIRCSKITYSSSNQKIQEWECMYVCFTNKRTLIVDASSMQSFGNNPWAADASSKLMSDTNSSDFSTRKSFTPWVNQVREKESVATLGMPSESLGLLRDAYYFLEVKDDDADETAVVLHPDTVKDIKLDFVHNSGAAVTFEQETEQLQPPQAIPIQRMDREHGPVGETPCCAACCPSIQSLHETANDIVRKLESGGKMFDDLVADYKSKNKEAVELFDKNRKLTAELAIFKKQKAKIEASNMRHLVSRKLVINLHSGARFELFPSEEESVLSLAQMLSMLQPKLAPFEFELVDTLRTEIKTLEEYRVGMMATQAEALEKMKEEVAKLSAERSKMTWQTMGQTYTIRKQLEQLSKLSHDKIAELEEDRQSAEEAYQSELAALRDATEHQASLQTKKLEVVKNMADKLKAGQKEDDDNEREMLMKNLEEKDKTIKELQTKHDNLLANESTAGDAAKKGEQVREQLEKNLEEKEKTIKELETKHEDERKQLKKDLKGEHEREMLDNERKQLMKDLEEKNKTIKELQGVAGRTTKT